MTHQIDISTQDPSYLFIERIFWFRTFLIASHTVFVPSSGVSFMRCPQTWYIFIFKFLLAAPCQWTQITTNEVMLWLSLGPIFRMSVSRDVTLRRHFNRKHLLVFKLWNLDQQNSFRLGLLYENQMTKNIPESVKENSAWSREKIVAWKWLTANIHKFLPSDFIITELHPSGFV